jgi:antitoxin ParD1/3/4
MSNVEKISVSLTPEMAAVVRGAIESGDYASGSEVIREALREWKMKRTLQAQSIDKIRALWTQGIESGKGQFQSADKLKEEARKRLQEKKN